MIEYLDKNLDQLILKLTIKSGSFSSGGFTALSGITNKSEAKWYIHLLPEDYKTGKHYK